MNRFDKYIRSKAAQERTEVPASARDRVEQALANLPEQEILTYRASVLSRIAAAAVCFLFVTLFLLPNVSVVYAQALEQVPVIGDFVRVVTLRNYFYEDERHEMDIDVPGILHTDSEVADWINKDVSALTTALVNQFYRDLEITADSGYGSVRVDYETITNTERWFTLKLAVSETSASSNNYFRYYHLDKLTGRVVTLGDLFAAEDFSEILTEEIRRQMQAQMDADADVVYWIDDSEVGEVFTSVDGDQNFYWNTSGELVIVFDKYTIAPGSMGTLEFVIGKDVIGDMLASAFSDLPTE